MPYHFDIKTFGQKASNGLLILYTLSLAVEMLFSVQTSAGKIYLPELLFVPILFAFCFQIPTLIKDRKKLFAEAHLLDALIAAYVLVIIFSYFLHNSSHSLSELFGCGYMVALYTIFNLTYRYEHSIFFKKSLKVFILSGFIAAFAAFWSYFSATVLGNKSLILGNNNYPLLGNTIRACGYFRNPIFLANYLCCAIIVFVTYYLADFKKGKWIFYLGLLVLSIALYLTLTKSVLILIAVFAWFLAREKTVFKIRSFLKPLFLVGCIASLCLYLFLSHFMVVDLHNPKLEELLRTGFYYPEFQWHINEHYAAVPTFYYGTKRAALLAFYDSFPFGVGGDNLATYTRRLVAQGRHLRPFCCAPHSTFFGALAELGLLGFGLVIALFVKMRQIASSINFDNPSIPNVNLMSKALVFFFFFEGVTVDLMNVRHFWLFLALLSLSIKMNRAKKQFNFPSV